MRHFLEVFNILSGFRNLPSISLAIDCNQLEPKNQIAGGHSTLNMLADNSILWQNHV